MHCNISKCKLRLITFIKKHLQTFIPTRTNINNDFLKQVELKFYSMLDCYRYKNTISKIYARVLTS